MYTAIILAAGSSSRTKTITNKILYKINEIPVFEYSLKTFLGLDFSTIVVSNEDNYEEVKSYVSNEVNVIIGGETRTESVRKALDYVETKYVFIHDAARPLIDAENILNIKNELKNHDAVFLARNLSESLKEIKPKHKNVNRENYLLAETPQAFLTEKIKKAYQEKNNFFDDIEIYSNLYPNDNIKYLINNKPNIKITHKEDIIKVEALISQKETLRTGYSFDIHKLVENRKLILGGIEIPYNKGLLGHSDADVLLHVIGESILGALALGDLGSFYPDNDPKYKDISSTILLADINKMLIENKYEIINIDSQVFLEEPKINPYIKTIKEKIASILNIKTGKISVKATTFEKLESIGRKEAIAAVATCLIRRVYNDY